MERVLGLDVHAASCTLAVISQTGKRKTDFPIETNGHALVEAIRRIPGRKHLVFEEGIQSAWLYEMLSPHVDEIVVAGIPESRGQKSDRRDAYGPAEKRRTGALAKRIFKHCWMTGAQVAFSAHGKPGPQRSPTFLGF